MDYIYVLVVVVVAAFMAGHVTADTMLQLKLVSYTNQYGTKMDRSCCDIQGRPASWNTGLCFFGANGKCDYQFIVCVGRITHTREGEYMYCNGTLQTTGTIVDAPRQVMFGTQIGDQLGATSVNPMTFIVAAPWPQNLTVYVQDVDRDGSSGATRKEWVDLFETTIIQTPAPSAQAAQESSGILFGHWINSSLVAAVKVYCAEHFYGSDCSTFCQPRNNLEFCNDLGQIQCYLPGKGDSCRDACDPNPCGNGGTCSQNVTHFWCYCRAPWYGDLCNLNPCHGHRCQNNGQCQVQGQGYVCICPHGYSGRFCEQDIRPCGSSPCQNNGICQNQGNWYYCECLPGSSGDNCQYLVDFCQPQPCANNGICYQNSTHHWCNCPEPWVGDHCNRTLPCFSKPCQNGVTCRDLSYTQFACDCPVGFHGSLCDRRDKTSSGSSVTSIPTPSIQMLPTSHVSLSSTQTNTYLIQSLMSHEIAFNSPTESTISSHTYAQTHISNWPVVSPVSATQDIGIPGMSIQPSETLLSTASDWSTLHASENTFIPYTLTEDSTQQTTANQYSTLQNQELYW